MKLGAIGVSSARALVLAAAVVPWGFNAVAPARADDAPPPETQRWVSSVALGLAVTGGNSDTALFTGKYETKRAWEKDEFDFEIDVAYGKNNGEESQAIGHSAANWKHILKEPWYFGLNADFLHDSIARLAYRFTVGPVIGYYFIKNDATKLSAEVGPAFVTRNYYPTDTENFLAVRFGEKFEHKFNDSVKVWQALDVTPQVDDFGDYLAAFEIGCESALSKALALRVVGQDRYQSVPAAGARRNDTSLVASIVYKF